MMFGRGAKFIEGVGGVSLLDEMLQVFDTLGLFDTDSNKASRHLSSELTAYLAVCQNEHIQVMVSCHPFALPFVH